MRFQQIRVIAICIIRKDNFIFVFEGYDSVKNETFYRPLGGGIEYGERSSDAILRELSEEINADIENLCYIQTLENIFTQNGDLGHEIVFVYEGDFADKSFYSKNLVIGQEDNGEDFRAMWKSITGFQDKKSPLYPDGLLELLLEQ